MVERVLLVGGGGREHAMAAALRGAMSATDRDANNLILTACAGNRNPGIDSLAASFEEVDTSDPEAVTDCATRHGVDIAVIGPEAPLAAGVADALEAEDIPCFGPTAELARIETDKAYQREFMADHDIPGCPEFAVFEDVDAAVAYIEDTDHELAIKPTGLTGGKGVKVMGEHVDEAEAIEYVRESEYESFVLEERLVGEEFTVQAFVDDGRLRVTPAVQDHKRAYEGDDGPNTGGMGSYSAPALELPFMDEDDYHEAVAILQATVDALEGYRGVLYGQFMLTADGVRVIEFNARFGDPEAMNTLPVMNTPFRDVLSAVVTGEPLPQLSFAPRATVCKYAVPAGYPDDPEAGTELSIDASELGDALLFYASVDATDDGVVTTTSRAFAVVGIGETIDEAEADADDALDTIGLDGLAVRHDIGTEALIDDRIEHMETLRDDA